MRRTVTGHDGGRVSVVAGGGTLRRTQNDGHVPGLPESVWPGPGIATDATSVVAPSGDARLTRVPSQPDAVIELLGIDAALKERVATPPVVTALGSNGMSKNPGIVDAQLMGGRLYTHTDSRTSTIPRRGTVAYYRTGCGWRDRSKSRRS